MKQNLYKMMCLDLYLSGNENTTELSNKNSVLDNHLKTLPLLAGMYLANVISYS